MEYGKGADGNGIPYMSCYFPPLSNCCQIICVQMKNTLLPSSVMLPTLRGFQYEKVHVLFVHVMAVSMTLVQLHLCPTWNIEKMKKTYWRKCLFFAVQESCLNDF